MLQHRTRGTRGAFNAAVMQTLKKLFHLTHRPEFRFEIEKLRFNHLLNTAARLWFGGIQPDEFADLA